MPFNIFYLMLFFVGGLVLGSFYNVCIFRIPREESIAFPASHCTSCGHTLGSADLFPVFSWLFLKGKCRYCNAKISARYLFVELLTGIVFAGAYFAFGLTLALAFHLIFASILIMVTFIDIDHRIIPDRFIIAGLVLAVGSLFLVRDVSWKEALIGGAIGGGLLLAVDLLGRLIFKKEGMGLGDVKLMLMAGLYLGTVKTIVALLAAVWIGAVAGVIILKRRKDSEDRYMPFGPFLALGSMISVLAGKMIADYYLSLF